MKFVVTNFRNGDMNCTVSGVESVSGTGCSGASLPAGGSASCTITNTVFFEGIPTLSRWALGILAVLMLGTGLVAFRRIE